MTRLAMWSGPRNLSTAMMRSWENRPDTEVLDEPLYAAYLASTGLDHPARDEIIAAGPSDFDTAIAVCLSAPHNHAVSYQKHMAHHLLPHVDRQWLGEFHNCLLLRDPRRVLASYAKVRSDVTLDDIGIPQQLELLEHCELVIDSNDFLRNPRGYQGEICRRVGVTSDSLDAMLSWPSGSRSTDGVWSSHWYTSVDASTGFGDPATDDPPELTGHLADIAEEAIDIYEGLRRHRLVLSAR